jgi:thiol-disulfide isomerase/thioredoxin
MFGKIHEKIYNISGSSGAIILALLLVALFIGVAIYLYKTYISPKVNPSYVENKEILSDESDKEAVLYFFYTTWCPHCKSAKPEWQKIKEEYQDKTINNTRVLFREVDCDKEDKVANEFNVEGYPTIKLVKDGQVIEYDAKPNYETLVQFLNTTL